MQPVASNPAINTKAYWEHRFATDWTDRGGADQSAFFARVAGKMLPDWFLQSAATDALAVHDFGCATGDALPILADIFPKSVLSGSDFSKTAIATAKKRHPQWQFKATSGSWVNSNPTDIAFCSNTLEHFENWRKKLDELAKASSKYVVALVPYWEEELIDEHVVRFEADSFPGKLADGKRLLYIRALNTSDLADSRWDGAQLIAVYGQQADTAMDRKKSDAKPDFSDIDIETGIDLRRLNVQDATLVLGSIAIAERRLRKADKRKSGRSQTVSGSPSSRQLSNEQAIVDRINGEWSAKVDQIQAEYATIIKNRADETAEAIKSIQELNIQKILAEERLALQVKAAEERSALQVRAAEERLSLQVRAAEERSALQIKATEELKQKHLELALEIKEVEQSRKFAELAAAMQTKVTAAEETSRLQARVLEAQNQEQNLLRAEHNEQLQRLKAETEQQLHRLKAETEEHIQRLKSETDQHGSGIREHYERHLHSINGFADEVANSLEENVDALIRQRDQAIGVAEANALSVSQLTSAYERHLRSNTWRAANLVRRIMARLRFSKASPMNIPDVAAIRDVSQHLGGTIGYSSFDNLLNALKVSNNLSGASVSGAKQDASFAKPQPAPAQAQAPEPAPISFYNAVATPLVQVPGILPPASGEIGTTIKDKKTIAMQVCTLDRGGVEKVVYDLTVSLNAAGYRTIIICTQSEGSIAAQLRQLGVTVYCVGEDTTSLANILRAEGVTEVFLHHAYFGIRNYMEANVAIFDVVHNYYFWHKNNAADIAKMSEGFERVICVSENVKDYHLDTFAIPRDKALVINNPINLDGLIVPDDDQLKLVRSTRNETCFVNVAQYYPAKAQLGLVKAFARVHKERPEVRLEIVGSPATPAIEAKLRELIKREGIEDSVSLLGYCDRRQISKIYAKAHAFVLPSIYEGYSVSMAEACYYGLPQILTDVGGTKDIIHDNDVGITLPRIVDDMSTLTVELAETIGVEEESRITDHLVEAMLTIARDRAEWLERGFDARKKLVLVPEALESYASLVRTSREMRAVQLA